jgi:hypothetical protein
MSNGGIIGPYNPTAIEIASGIWNLNDVRQQRSVLGWPRPPGTLTFRTSTTGFGTNTAITLTHPVGVVAGDLCVLIHCTFDNDEDTLVDAPSDFTILQSRRFEYLSPNWMSQVNSYRILPNTNAVTLPSTGVQSTTDANETVDNQAYVALYFYLDRNIEKVSIRSLFSFASTGDPSSRTMDTNLYTNTPILVLGSVFVTSGVPAFNASTTTFDGTVTNTSATNVEMIVGYRVYNTVATTTFVIDCDDISNQIVTSMALAVQ